MTIEHLKTSDLIPYARNAKKHDASQVAKLAGSIREFGFTNPVLIDRDNGIIAGHGRVMAAQSLALETVPCIRLGHLTDTQRRAYILADNRLAEIGGGWDEEMLKLELADLAALDVDVAEIGFGAEDLAELEMEEGKNDLSKDYTHKIDAPVYEPKGEKPPIVELFNSERADDLLSKIEASKATEDIKRFLKTAASRHIVFDYGKIAEFYCHADKETQALMEDSALVIIDFKKALQLGYVKLKEEILSALESGSQSSETDDE
jgi:ParB-like chromosome segregation protein Spo0J